MISQGSWQALGSPSLFSTGFCSSSQQQRQILLTSAAFLSMSYLRISIDSSHSEIASCC